MRKIQVKMEQKGLTMEADREQVAMALKTWRLRQGLTQKQVADMWGMSRFTIMRVEKAKNISWMVAYRVFAKLSNELKKEEQQ